MSGLTSPATERTYGTERACRAFGVPRSSYYAWKKITSPAHERPRPKKRGPKIGTPDQELLTLIRDDLATSPFSGEGHRKVWARLRVLSGVHTSRKRVLRLMREANLLSPRRRPQGEAKLHAGTITTTQPNDMWGTSDGARIFTADEGWIWAFFCVDHWNSECLGHHVTKRGTRFAALEPAEVERGWRDMKHVLDLRPVYHRKEERIRAHVLLCWLALLLIRVCETSCADTWPNLRRELEKMKIGTFAGDAGTFRRRTDTTANQRAIFSRLTLTEPPKIQELTPVLEAS